MKSNGLMITLLLAALGMGGWATWERRQKVEVMGRLGLAEKEREVLRLTAQKKLALGSKTEVKSDGPQGLGAEHAEALAKEALGEEKPGAEEAKKNPMSAMAEMMKDPSMREAMKAQMRPQVDFMYRDLFDLLGLDPEKQEKLTKLLLDRMNAGMEVGLAMAGGAQGAGEEVKQRAEAMKAANEASEAEIKSLLGDSGYGQYERFEKSQPERQQISALNGQLKDKGLGLSEEAESKLMDAMYEERNNFKFDVNFADQKTMDPTQLTEENVNRYQEQQALLRGQVLAKAEGILTEPQLEVFRKSQEQQAAMEKMGLQMGVKMMGASKK